MDYIFNPAFYYACCTSCLYLIQVPTIILCTLFEIMKINLFHKYNLPINETIEYIYFALATFTLVSTVLFACIQSCLDNWQIVVKWINRISSLLWILIPVLYAYLTNDELEPIPFSCPKDYPYPNPSKSYYNICLIRFLNLMFMWVMFLTTLYFTLHALIPKRMIDDWKSNRKNDNERKESDV